jgi:hypothetical protein
MHIKPGNQKSLWDAVKIARDENTSSIPKKMKCGDDLIEEHNIPEGFAQHFTDKVNNITKETESDTNI